MNSDGHPFELLSPADLQEAVELLASSGLSLDRDVELTLGIRRDGRLVATGSFAGMVIKCLAVADEFRGQGLSAVLVTALLDRLADKGIHHQFIFTRPPTDELLAGLGFTEIARVDDKVVLLEGGLGSVSSWAENLANHRLNKDKAAAVVVNANPLTLGHLHLLRHALKAEGALHILVVSTERSLFPTRDRLAIIREATRDWPDTMVHEAGDYIVSMATFPAYFTREEELAFLQARLDVALFIRHVVPALGLTARYVGEEPYCPVTALYNRAMSKALPAAGVRFEIIARKESGGQAISASRVRQILRESADPEQVRSLVPRATFNFLTSPAGKLVIRRIQSSTSRH